jgi:hypothetical protein
MYRPTALIFGFVLLAGTSAFAQFPAQPPSPASPLGQANEQERAACHPDVVKFCQAQLAANADDVLGILGCLQKNRSNISATCRAVLASHGQ